jgi:hypothetical protein
MVLSLGPSWANQRFQDRPDNLCSSACPDRATLRIFRGCHGGVALALLDSVRVSLPLYLPVATRMRMVGYGMPHVGNPAFANYVDALHSAADSVPAVTVTHNVTHQQQEGPDPDRSQAVHGLCAPHRRGAHPNRPLQPHVVGPMSA